MNVKSLLMKGYTVLKSDKINTEVYQSIIFVYTLAV